MCLPAGEIGGYQLAPQWREGALKLRKGLIRCPGGLTAFGVVIVAALRPNIGRRALKPPATLNVENPQTARLRGTGKPFQISLGQDVIQPVAVPGLDRKSVV